MPFFSIHKALKWNMFAVSSSCQDHFRFCIWKGLFLKLIDGYGYLIHFNYQWEAPCTISQIWSLTGEEFFLKGTLIKRANTRSKRYMRQSQQIISFSFKEHHISTMKSCKAEVSNALLINMGTTLFALEENTGLLLKCTISTS